MPQKIFRLLAWCSLLAIFLFTDAPIWLRPVTHFSPNIERFTALLVVAALFVVAYPKKVMFITTFLICAVGLFEALQMLFAGRHAELHDVAVKDAGVLAGVWLGSLLIDLAHMFRTAES
jgi:VanZ family protein